MSSQSLAANLLLIPLRRNNASGIASASPSLGAAAVLSRPYGTLGSDNLVPGTPVPGYGFVVPTGLLVGARLGVSGGSRGLLPTLRYSTPANENRARRGPRFAQDGAPSFCGGQRVGHQSVVGAASMVSSSTSSVAMSSQMILRWISSLWSSRDLFVDVWTRVLPCMKSTLQIEDDIGYPRSVPRLRKKGNGTYRSHSPIG